MKERKTKKEKKERKTMILSDTSQDYHEPSRTATAVSELSQAPEPGRATQRNAKAVGFGNSEVVDTTYADFFSSNKATDDFPGVQMSSSKFICGYKDLQVQISCMLFAEHT